ncbi:MAG TPA: glycosyltransferase family 4 protein [Chitinophagaceae bacterium]|nr:glycosyltransferase family 4 protein [Chitinophagaceae bacterium]
MPIVIAHPTGNEFSKAAVRGFFDKNILQSYYTTVANFRGSVLDKLGAFRGLSEIKRRDLDSCLRSYTRTFPWKELGRQVALKTGATTLTKHETGSFSVDAVYKSFDRYVSKQLDKEKKNGATAVYAYEDGAYYTFQKAAGLNLQCLYDLPIGYWRSLHRVLQEEKELNPVWAITMEGLKDSKEKLARKDEELRLSDAVFVASSFTEKTLNDYPIPLKKIYKIPYGFPPAVQKDYAVNKRGKIKALFIGGLSQRKGLSYLFKAVEGLERFVDLTVVGRLPQTSCEPLMRELDKHTYISSLPHKQVLELMREQDVLLFPSLFEGFGQVITEAMAQGTPVITTERTAGPDIIRHGENGWLVNAGSAEAIKNVLEQIISQPAVIAELGEQALETAKKRPWTVYGEDLVKAVLMEN